LANWNLPTHYTATALFGIKTLSGKFTLFPAKNSGVFLLAFWPYADYEIPVSFPYCDTGTIRD